jgi:hypothetical protein
VEASPISYLRGRERSPLVWRIVVDGEPLAFDSDREIAGTSIVVHIVASIRASAESRDKLQKLVSFEMSVLAERGEAMLSVR